MRGFQDRKSMSRRAQGPTHRPPSIGERIASRRRFWEDGAGWQAYTASIKRA